MVCKLVSKVSDAVESSESEGGQETRIDAKKTSESLQSKEQPKRNVTQNANMIA